LLLLPRAAMLISCCQCGNSGDLLHIYCRYFCTLTALLDSNSILRFISFDRVLERIVWYYKYFSKLKILSFQFFN
jgi:hypothetical protein